MKQLLSKVAVIGEDEKPLALPVEPPHRKEAVLSQLFGEEITHHWIVGVLYGADIPLRLVEKDIFLLLRKDRLSVKGHRHLSGHPVGRKEHHLSVDPHSPSGDELLHSPAGARSSHGEEAIEPYAPDRVLCFSVFLNHHRFSSSLKGVDSPSPEGFSSSSSSRVGSSEMDERPKVSRKRGVVR